MWQVIIRFIAVVIILSGVTLIFDARIITKKYFGFGDQNEATDGLKIMGYIVAMIGGLILYYNL